MRQLDIAKTETVRVLAVASQYIGRECTIDDVAAFAKAKRASAETRDEISYLKEACSGKEYNPAMVINISDNLVRKFEDGAFEGVLGFGMLERVFGAYSQGGKFFIGAGAAIVLQIVSLVFLIGSDFRELPDDELVIQGVALWMMVSVAGVFAAWSRSINDSKWVKSMHSLAGYAFAGVYGYILYAANLGEFSSGLTFGGDQWAIAFATMAPTIAPVAMIALAVGNQPVVAKSGSESSYVPMQENSLDIVEQRVNSGFIQLDPEGRSRRLPRFE